MLENPAYFLPDGQNDEVGHQNDENYQDKIAEAAPGFLGLVLLHAPNYGRTVQRGQGADVCPW